MESQSDVVLNDLSGYLGSRDPGEIAESQQARYEISHHEFSLPPADGGKDAWLFLTAGFMVEALVWGQSKSFLSQCCQHRFYFRCLSLLS
jgi:hypothetical protein